jgi:hypothetical protein
MSSWGDSTSDLAVFYRHVLLGLNASQVPFLVGGAFAFTRATGIERDTKDLDLFIRERDYPRAAQALARAGYATELSHPHWLGKARDGEFFIDLIFSSGNGVAVVDDEWFAHAIGASLLGIAVRIAPVEETIWSKAFVMERERYDGADVAHLLHACAATLDWPRLLRRFGPNWRVLLAHLVLYGFVYPGRSAQVPPWVMERLLAGLHEDPEADPAVCRGTLLSREQYLVDVERLGYADARVTPRGNISPEHAAHWTRSIPGRA